MKSLSVIVTFAASLTACTSNTLPGTADNAAGDGSGGLATSSGDESAGDPADGTGSPGVGNGKATIDEGAIVGGVVVTLTDNDTRGSVTVPLVDPLPAVSDMALSMEMLGAVSLLASSVVSGSSADFGAADLAMAMLQSPGEFTWETNEARDEVTMRFVNQTPSGLMLVPGSPYNTQLSVMPNDYVNAMPAISFGVTVVSE